ncbi:hypothetical protein IQ06DRAFT_36521 [Phaeosphaeriaceae sp. SRC1lsM3a]|nr:hypothetical protein IQ06DRAFT_36521 [Stagonospora sp. SRC1lsM3a]
MMLEKESGMIEGNRFGSLWTICTLPNGQRRYKNVVTKTLRTERPSLCLGGILADEMGLGKTLTALALIATSLDRTDQMNTMWCRTTLIVTPMSLLSSWEEQLKSHLHSGTITWIVYHGDAKRSSVAFEDYDVVLTTYDTIAAGMVVERNFNKQSSNSLTSFDWYRVVLDEAHLIRNISTARHNAVRALKAQHRWCITGTPIFNRVEDLGSLLNFLRIHHFDAKSFADHIVRPLKHDPVLGLANLKSLLQAVSLRRTKASVSGELCLAPRIDRVENVQLTSAERRLYNMVRRGFSQHLSSSNKKGGPPGHVFQTILRLRQLCNLGFDMIQSRNFEKFKDARNYERLALFLLEGSDTCTLCGENVQGEHTSYAKETDLTCGHQFCGLCMERNFNPTMVLAQDCPVCSGFLESSQHDDHEQPVRVSMSRDRHEPSSKLRALLGNLEAEIQARTSGTSSKSIVISSWTQVLDVVEAELNTKSIGSTRIDGGKSESKRREALTKFRTEDSCSILLASLGSVGVGLNLTVASNIHLLEPQWSPMAEEQALDRVYRLGQTYQVVATRYIVENSIEQYVVAVQRAKIRVIRSSVGEDLPTEANQDMQKLMKYIADSPADCED